MTRSEYVAIVLAGALVILVFVLPSPTAVAKSTTARDQTDRQVGGPAPSRKDVGYTPKVQRVVQGPVVGAADIPDLYALVSSSGNSYVAPGLSSNSSQSTVNPYSAAGPECSPDDNLKLICGGN